jgi:hypothetical protein
MRGWQQGNERIPPQRHGRDAIGVASAADDRDVYASSAQVIDLSRRSHLAQRQPNERMPLAESPQHHRKHSHHRKSRVTDGDDPDPARRDLTTAFHAASELSKDPLRGGEKRSPLACQFDLATGPSEKCESHPALKSTYRLAQGGLCDTELCRRSAEVKLFGNDCKVSQGLDFKFAIHNRKIHNLLDQ